jgi:hypothetical protein
MYTSGTRGTGVDAPLASPLPVSGFKNLSFFVGIVETNVAGPAILVTVE